MKKNMGRFDRLFRLVAALILLGLVIFGTVKGTVAVILVVLAVIFVLTTLVGFCPAYRPLGVSTTRETDKDKTPRVDA